MYNLIIREYDLIICVHGIIVRAYIILIPVHNNYKDQSNSIIIRAHGGYTEEVFFPELIIRGVGGLKEP